MIQKGEELAAYIILTSLLASFRIRGCLVHCKEKGGLGRTKRVGEKALGAGRK